MLEKGDHVVYGNHGLCRVTDITVPEFLEGGNKKLYYVMEPSTDSKGVLYVPVEGAEEKMRKPIARSDAGNLMDCVVDIELLDIPQGKKAEAVITGVIHRNLSCEMMRLIKTLRRNKALREAQGKKFASQCERYLVMAEKLLYSEIAYSIRSDMDTVKRSVSACLEGVGFGAA